MKLVEQNFNMTDIIKVLEKLDSYDTSCLPKNY